MFFRIMMARSDSCPDGVRYIVGPLRLRTFGILAPRTCLASDKWWPHVSRNRIHHPCVENAYRFVRLTGFAAVLLFVAELASRCMMSIALAITSRSLSTG